MPHTTEEILGLFDLWNEALQSCDPDRIVKLYTEDAILLPTLSNTVRHNSEERRSYFVDFMKKKPVGKIIESNVRIFDDIAINSGIYTFLLTAEDGSQEEVSVRYSFGYQHSNGEWKIIEHHSSLMPEA